MVMIEQSDFVAIRRIFEAGGRNAALAGLRRRYLALPGQSARAGKAPSGVI